MEKSEMMKRYEAETGCNALDIGYDELLREYVYSIPKQYGDWLEAKSRAWEITAKMQQAAIEELHDKATAYDRLMSREAIDTTKEQPKELT